MGCASIMCCFIFEAILGTMTHLLLGEITLQVILSHTGLYHCYFKFFISPSFHIRGRTSLPNGLDILC